MPDLPAAATDIATQPPKVEAAPATAPAAPAATTTAAPAAPAAAPAAPAAAAAPSTHTIVAGDNYWNLAKEIYGDGFMWKKISEANPGLNPNKLPIGGTLTIPPKG